MKSEVGLSKKNVILEYVLIGYKICQIIKQTNTFVSVGVNSSDFSQIYYINSSYGNVSIRIEI
jgi:hypothetical protein